MKKAISLVGGLAFLLALLLWLSSKQSQSVSELPLDSSPSGSVVGHHSGRDSNTEDLVHSGRANDTNATTATTIPSTSKAVSNPSGQREDLDSSSITLEDNKSRSRPPGIGEDDFPPSILSGRLNPDDFAALEEVRRVMPNAFHSEAGRYPPESLLGSEAPPLIDSE